MGGQLDGRTVIVTGAGTGIGAGVARDLAGEGAAVLLLGRTAETLEETKESIVGAGGEAVAMRADVLQQEDIDGAVERAVKEWGRIDGLVNNAGVFEVAHSLEMSRDAWDSVISTNLSAVFFVSQAVGRVMARAESGSIVNMSSVDGHLAEATNAPYNTAKAGLFGLTRSLAIDLGPLGVRCNTVSPGYVEGTPMAEDTVEDAPPLSQILRDWRRSPIRRMVNVEEVAATCTFLISDRASGLNGTDIMVDGGLTADLYALESVEETGWAEVQDQAIKQIKEDAGE